MIKAITKAKIGVNTKMLITLYKSLIQSVVLYAASFYWPATQPYRTWKEYKEYHFATYWGYPTKLTPS